LCEISDEEGVLSNQVDFIGGNYSAEQADLFQKWVESFGATDAKELDLGMLISIHEWVMGGFAPNGQRGER
jgi:hypothetical protein